MGARLKLIPKPSWRLAAYVCACIAILGVVSSAVIFLARVPKHTGRIMANSPPPITHVPSSPDLEIEKVFQHGHIVEIQAKVQPGTTVMVNGEKAAILWDQGRIKHFVGPLPDGVTVIAITVQDDKGGINSKQVSIFMP